MFSGNLKFSDEEDLFGAAPNGNNLANIFGTGMGFQEENDNVSLKYKSIKSGISNNVKTTRDSSDISNNNTNPNQSGDWKILLAEVVFAYKLLNKENISQGKLALALLKSSEDLYKIILYRTKTNVLSTTKLNLQKKMFIKNNYIQFEDDSSEFWSVIFEKSTNYELLMKELENITAIEYATKESGKSEEIDRKLEVNNSKVENNKTKENILSRMSKLGQPILLPKLPNSTEMSDSSDSEVISNTSSKPAVPSRKIHHYHNKTDSTNLVPYNPSQTILPSSSSIVMMASQDIPTSNSSLNIFLSENRTQNSEIRMNLLKLDTKIDRIIDRFDTLASTTNKNMHHDDQIIELEEKMLELKKENRQMKILLNENSDKIKLDELEREIKKIGLDNEKLCNKTERNLNEINDLNEELNQRRSKLDECNIRYNELLTKYSNLQLQFENIGEENKNLLTEKLIENNKVVELKTLIKKLEDELSAIKTARITEGNATETVVKDIINNMYHKICDQFTDKTEYSQNEIIKIIGRTIKLETNNQLKQFNKK